MITHYLIRLVQEKGDILFELQDTDGLVEKVITPYSERCNGLARYIDPYGKTSFNGIQCEVLINELKPLQEVCLQTIQHDLLVRLLGLLQRAATEVHLHVVFLGD